MAVQRLLLLSVQIFLHISARHALLMQIVLTLRQLHTVKEVNVVYVKLLIIVVVLTYLLQNVYPLLHTSAQHALWTQIALIFLQLHIVKEVLASIAKQAITLAVLGVLPSVRLEPHARSAEQVTI